MGLYDEYEDKDQHNYLCGKNGGKIRVKPTNFYDCKYGLDTEGNFAILLIYNENNIKFFEKIKNKKHIAYLVGFLIISFEDENNYYGFSVDEITNKLNKNIVFYLINKEKTIDKFIVDLVLV